MDIRIDHYFHQPGESETAAKLDQMAASLRNIEMNQAELETALVGVKATLEKVGTEIDAFKASAASDTAALQSAIAALEAELANAGGTSPATTALVAEITALSASLDTKIDDLPAPG